MQMDIGKLMPDTGSVMFDGQSVLGRKPHEINQMGIARACQTPHIFGDLTVLENMTIRSWPSATACFACTLAGMRTRRPRFSIRPKTCLKISGWPKTGTWMPR